MTAGTPINWTGEMMAELKRDWLVVPKDVLAKRFGCSPDAVENQAIKMHLPKKTRKVASQCSPHRQASHRKVGTVPQIPPVIEGERTIPLLPSEISAGIPSPWRIAPSAPDARINHGD